MWIAIAWELFRAGGWKMFFFLICHWFLSNRLQREVAASYLNLKHAWLFYIRSLVFIFFCILGHPTFLSICLKCRCLTHSFIPCTIHWDKDLKIRIVMNYFSLVFISQEPAKQLLSRHAMRSSLEFKINYKWSNLTCFSCGQVQPLWSNVIEFM